MSHRQTCVQLGLLTEALWEGIASGKDEVFYFSEDQQKKYQIEDEVTLPLLRGRDVKAWRTSPEEKYRVLYPYDLRSGRVLTERHLEEAYPYAHAYLVERKDLLKGRGYFDKSNKEWFELWCQRDPKNFVRNKIVTPEIAQRNNFSLDLGRRAFNTKVYGLIIGSEAREAYEYLLGVLNSQLLDFLYKLIAPKKAGGFYAYKTNFLRQLPIRTIDFSDPEDVARHERMVEFAERMLVLHEKLAAAKISQEKTIIQHQIEATDRQIDRLVYELYGLTEEEIKVVEGE